MISYMEKSNALDAIFDLLVNGLMLTLQQIPGTQLH